MSNRPPALGRGLGALLPGSPPPARPDRNEGFAPGATGAPNQLPVDLIDPNPEQPRRRFDAEQLERLADSILESG